MDPTNPGEEAEMVLVRRAAEGDREALEALLGRYQGLVYRYLLAMVEEEADAGDLAQETLVKAVRGLRRFRGDSPFRSWLLAIARNEARTWLRGRSRRREESLAAGPEPESREQDAEEVLARAPELATIRRALERLPRKQRLSVSLRILDGLSYREIGIATDSSEGAARVNYHLGIRRLREWLGDEGAGP